MKLALTTLMMLVLAAPIARAGETDLRPPIDDAVARARREKQLSFAGIFDRWMHEATIERHMALAEIRGRLSARAQDEWPDWSERSFGKGSVELGAGDVPIVRLEGTPEERGEQHGRLLGREARALAETYLRAFLGTREIDRARRRARVLFERHLSDDEKRELAAFADAAGIAREDALLAQGFADLYRAWGCSTLACGGRDPLLARNLDFVDMGFIHRFSCVFVVKPSEGEPFVSVGWPGLIGVLSGQNARGVALAVMVVHDEQRCHDGVPFQLAFRRALMSAKTADDVAATLRETDITVANNLSVVDRSGRARVLELAPDGVVVREGTRLVSTNHFVSEARREPRMTLTYLSSKTRYESVERVGCVGPAPADAFDESVSPDRAIAALRAAAPSTLNVQSMLFLPRAGEVWVALGRPPAAKRAWVKLEAQDLLGAK